MSKKLNKDLIKNNLTLEDVKLILNKLGARCNIENDKIISQTICHNLPSEENSYKLYYYDNNKMFHCYTGCDDPSFDIFELVRRAVYIQTNNELSFIQILHYVIDYTNIDINKIYEIALNEKDIDYDKYLDNENNNTIKTVECKQLDNLSTLRIYFWEKEFITYETLKKFNVKYDGYRHKIIMPHYNENGELIGIRGRALIDEDIEKGKYTPVIYDKIMYSHPLGYNLYGLNVNKENIEKYKIAIIVEGEKSVYQIDNYMDNISVAVCGFNITQWQINKLSELGVEEIILAFDKEYYEVGDEKYWKFYNKVKKMTDKIKNYVKVSVIIDYNNLLDYKDSPSDKGKEIFLKLLDERSFVKDEI